MRFPNRSLSLHLEAASVVGEAVTVGSDGPPAATATETSAAEPSLPLTSRQFAQRAYHAALNPLRNPVKEVMDRCSSVEETPPMLGIFNDIPWHAFREAEAHAWARAGFLWVVNDGEHSQWEGTYGRDQNAAELRLGMLPVQRLPREAVSAHGDTLQLGARATMRPYGTTVAEAEQYYQSLTFPVPGAAGPYDRGGYPVRRGDRSVYFTPESLREAERDIQGWLQFETAEYILDNTIRDRVLDLMAARGRNTACGFVGPFDALMRGGSGEELQRGIDELFRAAARRGVHMGRLVSPGRSAQVETISTRVCSLHSRTCLSRTWRAALWFYRYPC